MKIPDYDLNQHTDTLSRKTFLRFSTYIQSELGIRMPETKMSMLQSRLQKRLRLLEINYFDDYCDYVFSTAGRLNELDAMVDAITTNKTDFFRESQHFDYLSMTLLPRIIKSCSSNNLKTIKVWSAGCSTGEEPYTLAMVLNEVRARFNELHYSILATDISAGVLQTAITGIYDHEKAEPIPIQLRKKYLLRSKDRKKDLIRITPQLRAYVKFRQANLMKEALGAKEFMDIIFCRNVIIYFARPIQEKVLNRLYRHLVPGGFLFIGHSETLSGMNVPLTQVSSTIYQKRVL
ncbi:CheR family methyltransferase [Desulfococcaceae bacterium HSG7]|nr:CheR family methyltransferase [Desulfococcaceae bacterium HSG7]